MNDDDVSIRAEAASAYLDGELDAAERASVAADPATMALVDSFARVRGTLGDVESVEDDVRLSAISAAMAEFDARHVVSAVTPARVATLAAIRVLHTRWHRAYRVLGGVAAAAVIAVVGVAALKAGQGNDSKTSSVALPAAADDPTAAPRIEMAAPTATDAAAGTAAPGGAASEKTAPNMGPAVNNADDLARYAASFSGADAAMASTASTAAAAAGAAPADTERVPMPAAPPSACLSSTDVLLGPITVLGSPAFAIRDDATGIVRAIDADSCAVLLSTGP